MKKETVIGIILAIVMPIICIVLIIVLMRGETKTFGENPVDVQGKSLSCEGSNIAYPFFKYDDSISKNIKIIVDFYDNKFSAMSLRYTLYYDDEEQVMASEAHNHSAMNASFGESGLGADAYNAHYTKMDNMMKMELYTTGDIDTAVARYFMFDNKDYSTFPITPPEYQAIYESKGLTCILKN